MAKQDGTDKKTAASAAGQKKPEQKYELAKLQENCKKLFDVSTAVFVGAANGLTGKYTVSEMNEIIRKWKKEEVK